MSQIELSIEKAIRETLVIDNKESIKYAVDKIVKEISKSEELCGLCEFIHKKSL